MENEYPVCFSAPRFKPSEINTVMVIIGSGGTWVLNRYVIVPHSLSSYNPADMFSICMTLKMSSPLQTT